MHVQGKGFSLIEVMVALVVLVIGLVGVFNLHIVSKRGSFESFQQTQAAYFANDIVNRMKLNKSELASYVGNYSGGGTEPKKCDVAPGANVICTNSETRLWDLYQWQSQFTGHNEKSGTQLVGGLDKPTACIKLQGNQVSVIMTWQGIRKLKDGAANQSTEIQGCGTASDRRRVFVLNTRIL